jgi:hypothetical protein
MTRFVLDEDSPGSKADRVQLKHWHSWSILKSALSDEHAQNIAVYHLVVSLVAFASVASLQGFAG